MTQRELIQLTEKALELHRQLSVEDRVQRLIARGSIDENGKVLTQTPDGHAAIARLMMKEKKESDK